MIICCSTTIELDPDDEKCFGSAKSDAKLMRDRFSLPSKEQANRDGFKTVKCPETLSMIGFVDRFM